MNSADLCRKNGWKVGTILEGEKKRIVITAIGETSVLAKSFDLQRDTLWFLDCRDWKEVEEKTMETIQVKFQFEVGDFVQTAWDVQTQPKGDNHLRGVWQVIERTFCEHCGGHRIQYVCRSQAVFTDKTQTVAFDACELVAVEAKE